MINKKEYIDKLEDLITSDYVYIDFPMHFNIGDSLITMGSLELLSYVPHRCKYISSISCFVKSKIKKSHIIILHGGGNFGDLYQGANDFRNEIIKSFPDNKIIIFPQTICYLEDNSIEKDIQIMSKHKDLTILVRDKNSYEFAKEKFVDNKILMFPDTAMFLSFKKRSIMNKGKTLFMLRKDKEVKDEEIIYNDSFEYKDWDDVLKASVSFKVRLSILKLISYIRRHVPALKDVFSCIQNWYFLNFMTNYMCFLAIDEFRKYDLIITTRLHGAILSYLLGIPFTIEDNKYNKCNNFFSTWFTKL